MEAWVSENRELFSDFDLGRPCVELIEVADYWRIGAQRAAIDHPSYEFFSQPILAVERSHSNAVISVPVDVSFFKPEIWKYKVDTAVETQESREYADMKRGFYGMVYEGISVPTKFMEPVVAEVFLYDKVRKRKVTDSWRFLANRDNFDAKALELIEDKIVQAPKDAAFPYVIESKNDLVVVCFLERLVMKEKCGKYLMKPSESHFAAIKRGVGKCKSKGMLTRFAYGFAPFSLGDQRVVIRNFVMNAPFDLNPEVKEKNRWAGCECIFGHMKSNNFVASFDEALAIPYSGISSLLKVKLLSVQTKSVTDRCFVEMNVTWPNGSTPDVFRSRVLGEEKDAIMDIFSVPLPPGVCSGGQTKLGFTLRAVGDRKEKKKSDVLQTAEFVVSNNGLFVPNGEHAADWVTFATLVCSPFYTTSVGVNKLWKGSLPEDIAELDQQEVIRNFYSIMHVLMKMGTSHAFVWMFQIIGLVDEVICDGYCRLMNPPSNVAVELLKQLQVSRCKWSCFFEVVLKCVMKFKEKNPELDDVLLGICQHDHHEEDFALFLKDLFEIYDRNVVIQMLGAHLATLNLERDPEHRKHFRTIMKWVWTPKGFLIANAPRGDSTIFLDTVLPYMTITARVYRHTCDLVRVIDDLIVQFDGRQQDAVLKHMTHAAYKWFDRNSKWIDEYPKIEDRRYVSLFAGLLLRVTKIEGPSPLPGFLVACKQYLKYFSSGPMESLFVDILKQFSGLEIVNCVISGLMKRNISPQLLVAIMDYIQRNAGDFFSENSQLKSLMCSIVAHLDHPRLEILSFFLANEELTFETTTRCISLFTRALNKVEVTEHALSLVKGTLYGPVFQNIYDVNQQIKDVSEEEDPVTYASLLRRKADLLKKSPDARIETLLQLANVHLKTKHYAEAVSAQLSCALLVNHHLFGTTFPIDYVKGLKEKTKDIKINGYCTSKYFTPFGLSVLLEMAVESAKRGSMYELINQIHSVLIPLAEEKGLWLTLKQIYLSGSGAWGVINELSTGSDRDFGVYYRVQFEDQGEYIYREIDFANLWTVNEEMKRAAKPYAKGKEIVVQNDGEEIHDKEPGKYYIHVKSVQPYFTADEKKQRGTPFEQNENISKFHFDIPVSKASQESISNCWLKRYIFELKEPMPTLETRVSLNVSDKHSIMYSPIEFCCENLSKQVQMIESATKRKNYQALQPLIHGSLLVQVNEGPKKMAEVFLTGGEETEHTAELRRIFRRFLKVNEHAVQVHSEFVKQNPVYSSLQDELELGLARLKSSLQPYLN